MPVHDWSRVDAGIFHDFHQAWIGEIKRVLNRGLLPSDFYALTEQRGGGFEPDVLALKSGPGGEGDLSPPSHDGGVLTARPSSRVFARAERAFYLRKQNRVAIRHASGDELVAVVEIVSRGNKAGQGAMGSFVGKAAEFLFRGVHLLIADLQPPTPRDPQGIHGAIWAAVEGDPYEAPADKPLTLASYDASSGVDAFVEPIAVGDVLPAMPLFLGFDRHVPVPLEATYLAAWESVPRRWRDVIATA